MKIGIPVTGENLCAHFGHCEQFAIFTVENSSIIKRERLTPPPHEPGVIPTWLAEQDVRLVLAGGMGERAQMIFEQKGVKVICGIKPGVPDAIVREFLNHSLVTGNNPCSHDEEGHDCHGGR